MSKQTDEQRRYQREWYAKNRQKRRAQARRSHYRTKYGIELEEAVALWAEQAGLCRCCGKWLPEPGTGKRARDGGSCVDHDHQTGRVRGILCTDCNMGIGKLGDSVAGLKQALEYLS